MSNEIVRKMLNERIEVWKIKVAHAQDAVEAVESRLVGVKAERDKHQGYLDELYSALEELT